MAVARAYLRASTDDQHLSPEAQRHAISGWATRATMTIVSEHEDLGISGATGLDKRPGLLNALNLLQRGDVLVVARRDRLGRDALVLAMVEASVARKGARIVSAAGEGTDGDDPTHVLMRRIVDAFAEYERLVLKARTRAALKVKQRRGERTGSIPYGSRLDEDTVHLIDVAEEQVVVREARRLRGEGLSLRNVATELERQGMLSRSGRPFAAVQVARMTRERG
jgi:DNA invertase Pin-like site-specific DNA recombinase